MRALLVVLGSCAAMAVGCGGEDGSDRGEAAALVGAVVTDSPAHAFAPVVYFHPAERYLPMSGKQFVASSTLYFGEDGDCDDHRVAKGRRDLPRLTEGQTYAVRPYEDLDCRRRSARAYAADEVTRPHDNTDARVWGLRPEEGFFLDLDDGARAGSVPSGFGGRLGVHGAAAWYVERPQQVEGAPGRRVSWWMVLGMHAPRSPDGPAVRTLTHEGDWERVDVLLRGQGKRWKPVALRVFDSAGGGAREGGVRDFRWDELRHEAAMASSPGEEGRTHPVLFAALGSHTLYPRPGARVRREVNLIGQPSPVRDVTRARCRRCPRMEFEAPGFPLESQDWYGFGGAWGERGRTTLTTGPLGPRPRGS